MTYADLIRSSLRLIGQLAPGRGPNNSEITDALFVLNSMLDAWTIERLMIYTVERNTYPVAGAQITFGPGGDYPERPVRIESAAIIYSGAGYEYPVDVLTQQRWAAGGGPTRPGPSPGGVYYDGAFPTATLSLSMLPTNIASVALYTWQPLTQIVDENATVVFPPGYADAIRYNLAVRCAPEWQKAPRPEVMDMAVQSKANVKSFNMQTPEMDASDGGALGCGRGAYNIYTDSR